MLNALLQTNSYKANLNSAVSKAVADTKPDLIANDRKSERATQAKEPSARVHMTLSMESVNKAIDVKVAEFFSKYPNGGSDQDVAKFLESARSAGG
jgi:hypothetical protein